MEAYSFSPRGKYARLFNVAVFGLAIGLMFLNARGPRHKDSFACLGLLGTGFPASLLCDYSDGGAPVFDADSSYEQIDEVDFPYLSPQGFIVDLLFFVTAILVVWFLITYGIHLARRTRLEDGKD